MNIEYIDSNDPYELVKKITDDKDYVECQKYDAYLEKELSENESDENFDENSFKYGGKNGKLSAVGYRNGGYNNPSSSKEENCRNGNLNTNNSKKKEEKNGINSIADFILKVSNSNKKKPHNLRKEPGKKIFHINAKKTRIMISSDESDKDDKFSSVRNIVNRSKRIQKQKGKK